MNLEDLKKLINNKDQTDLIYEMSRLLAENGYLKELLNDKEKQIERLAKLSE